NLTNRVNGLIIPGIAGDSETLTSVTAAHGPARLTNGVLTYAAPSIGSDAIAYAVVDQYGDTASGTVNVTIDPGPTAATGATTVGHNQTANLTNLVNGLINAVIAGSKQTTTTLTPT